MRVSEFTVTNTDDSDSTVLIQSICSCVYQKNDQLGIGANILINRDSENAFLFDYCVQYFLNRPKSKGPALCHFDTTPLTSYQFNAVLKKSLAYLGYNPTHYSSHSFRIGGATALYIKGKTEEEIKAFGRWKSDAWKSSVRL